MTDTRATAPNVEHSEALFERAQTLMPGGVSSPVRAFSAVGGTPRFIERGQGPYVFDADDNRYVDFVMSWGPLIHGHAYPDVVQAISAAATDGTSFGAPTERELTLASMLIGTVATIEMVRFVSSGTEAAMSAIRLARGFTGRDLVVKFAGNYHGHADGLLAQAGSGSLTLGVPTSPGVSQGAARSTIVAPYNEPEVLEEIFSRYGEEIACVIVEPIAGNMGVVPPEPAFLQTIQRCCRQMGSLFLCDEVITGFRVGLGGAQARYRVQPDLTTLGKIVGGGLPVGAYGGRRQIMECVSPAGPVYQAGTLSGNPLAMAAGIATLQPLLKDGVYTRLDELTGRLAGGLRAAAARVGVPVTINVATGMLTVFFTPGPVRRLSDAQDSDTGRYARFFHAMLARGFYLPPSQYEAWMLSTAHGEAEINAALEAAEQAFAAIRSTT